MKFLDIFSGIGGNERIYMANKYTYTNPISKDQLIKDYFECGMSQNEISKKHNTTQKIVWRLFKTYGLNARTAAKRNQLGEKNSTWKNGTATDNHGYVLIKCPGHPRAKKCGDYVPKHILIMEQHIGRYLNFFGTNNGQSEIVHHINGDKTDNRIENLLLTTIADHARIHKSYLKATKVRWCKCQAN